MEKNLLPALLLVLGLSGCKNYVSTPESRAEPATSAEYVQPPTLPQETQLPILVAHPTPSAPKEAPPQSLGSLARTPLRLPVSKPFSPLDHLSTALIPLTRAHERYDLRGKVETENGVLLTERDPVATMLAYGIHIEALNAQRSFVPGTEFRLRAAVNEAHAGIGYFGSQVFRHAYEEELAHRRGYNNRILTKEMIAEAGKNAGKARAQVVNPVHTFFNRYREPR